MALTLDAITSGFNLDKIQNNFQLIQDFLNNDVLKREIVEGVEQNEMRTDLDMNQNRIINTNSIISAQTLDLALAILEDMGYDTGT